MEKTKDIIRRDKILNGNILSVIVLVCLPLFIYNFFTSLYSFIDTFMASSISMEGVSSIASISQIKQMISSLGIGIASGGGILIARSFGSGDYEKGNKIIRVLVTLAFIISCLVLLICIPFSRQILLLCGLDETLLEVGISYFIVQIITLVISLYNSVFISIQKSKGDTKPIFYLNIVSMAIKLSLNLLFIYGFKVKDTMYIALSTLVAELILSIILYLRVNKKDSIFKVNLLSFDFSLKEMKSIVLISVPIILGKFMFAFGKVSVNAMCKNYGPMVVGALAISNNICGLITSPLLSFEEGGSTIISQNLGNKNPKRAFSSFIRCLIISLSIGIIGYVLVRFIFQDEIISIFASTQSEIIGMTSSEFMALIKSISDYDTLSIIALSINSVVLGVLYGYGKTGLAMIVNIFRVVIFRVPVLWYLQTFHQELGAAAAGISMGISNILIAIMSTTILVIFLISQKKKEKKYECKNI